LIFLLIINISIIICSIIDQSTKVKGINQSTKVKGINQSTKVQGTQTLAAKGQIVNLMLFFLTKYYKENYNEILPLNTCLVKYLLYIISQN